MAIVNVGDLLDRASEFEGLLEKYYATISDGSQDEGAKLLTGYLVRHCRHLQKALNEFDPEKVKCLRRIMLKYDIEFRPQEQFGVLRISPENVKGSEILEIAVKHDVELTSLCRKILRQPLENEAEELLEALIRVEERDIVMLKKMIAMNYF